MAPAPFIIADLVFFFFSLLLFGFNIFQHLPFSCLCRTRNKEPFLCKLGGWVREGRAHSFALSSSRWSPSCGPPLPCLTCALPNCTPSLILSMSIPSSSVHWSSCGQPFWPETLLPFCLVCCKSGLAQPQAKTSLLYVFIVHRNVDREGPQVGQVRPLGP